jgi:hypothetical protein
MAYTGTMIASDDDDDNNNNNNNNKKIIIIHLFLVGLTASYFNIIIFLLSLSIT